MTDELLDIPDDALLEIKEVCPNLTEKERKYVYWRTLATPPALAAERAGYQKGQWRQVETRPKMRTALADLQEQLEPEYRVTRKRVQGLILEGIEIARRKDQAKTIIEGAVALGNIAGVAAPQKMQIQQETRQIKGSAAPALGMQLARMPRKELEKLMDLRRTLPLAEVIEADYEEINVAINEG